LRKLEILLVGICMLVTAGLFANSIRENADVANTEFRRLTTDSVERLQLRMDTYLQSLNATAAFFNASDRVTLRDFDGFVDQLEIEKYLPGISGIGYIVPVVEGEETALIEKMAGLGETRLKIHPETGNAEKFIINRISPFGRNAEALGLDVSFEAGRLKAVKRARETGTPQLTPRILLVQEDSREPGFLLLRPLFVSADPMVKPDPETAEFNGLIYAAFVGRNLLTNLTPNQGVVYHFNVYDGDTADKDALIYASETGEAVDSGGYTNVYTIEVFGQNWTVAYESTAAFDAGFSNTLAWTILVGGLLLSGLLMVSVRSMRIRSEARHELASLRERQVNAREEENRAVVENAVTAVFILDGQRRILFANQAALASFGYTAAQIKGLVFDTLITPSDATAATHGYNATGQTRDGQALVLDLHCNDWTTFEGAMRITAIVRDLTNEFAAREETRITKVRYDQALEGARIGVFDVDLRTGDSDVTDTWREIMGFAPDHDIQRPQDTFLERVHVDDLAPMQQSDRDCIEGRTPRSSIEYRVRFDDGTWRWMRSDAIVVERDSEGKALRMIGTQSDITELRESRSALEVSEKRFRKVLAVAPIGMVLMDQGGHFVGVNDAFCALSGYDEAHLLNKVRMPDLMAKEDRRKIYSEISDLMRGDETHVYSAEHQITHANGTERWGMFHISWAYDRNKDEHYFIAQIIDITDQKKIDQIKNEFVSTVSHELRTPLTSIKGALGLIMATGGEALDASKTRLIDIAMSNTERLTTIVNDILDLEKIATGEVNFAFQDIDMADLIEDAVQEISPFAITHNNSIRVDLPQTPLPVSADFSRTKQVLANLISNACKYSDAQSEVLIKSERIDDKVIVYIQNRGAGIPESFKPRMFQAFSQADSSDTRAKGGTGLGLNITKQIISRHGGEIGFESVPGGVTVFWFTYPVTEAEEDPQGFAPNVKPLQRLGKARVLHLEDDSDFAEVVRSGLAGVADVTHACTVEQAREIIARGGIDLLIVDWAGPDGAATRFLDDIGQSAPNVRILGLSSDGNQLRDRRMIANLEKSRTELSTIAEYVSARIVNHG
jgi:PAS domain S-box-containing protein